MKLNSMLLLLQYSEIDLFNGSYKSSIIEKKKLFWVLLSVPLQIIKSSFKVYFWICGG